MRAKSVIKRNICMLAITVFFAAIVLSACGAKMGTDVSQVEYAMTEAAMDIMEDVAEEGMVESYSTAEGKTGEGVDVTDTSRKLIKNVNISAETKEFDALLDTLNKQVSKLEGYIQSSEISGNNYNNNSNRYAEYVIRIPAERLDEFITTVKGSANIIHETEGVDDVTLKYVDIESHITALKTEQESLLKMLESADKLDDIIKIQSRLTEVRYEIESYESQLRTYDNLVSYSTVYLNINEVERETETIDVSLWGRIKERFSNSLYNIKESSKTFIIWFIGSLPYIIIWVVILGLMVLAVRKIDSKYRKIKTQPEHDTDAEEKKPVDATDAEEKKPVDAADVEEEKPDDGEDAIEEKPDTTNNNES